MEHLDIWVFGVVAPDYMKDRRDLFYILADQIEIIGGAFKLHLPSGSQTGYLRLKDKSNARMAVDYLETRTVRFRGRKLKFALRDDGEQQQEQTSGLRDKKGLQDLMQHNEVQPLGLLQQATDEPFTTTAVAAFNIAVPIVGPLLDLRPAESVVADNIAAVRRDLAEQYHRSAIDPEPPTTIATQTPSKSLAEQGTQTRLVPRMGHTAADGSCCCCFTTFKELGPNELNFLPCGHPVCSPCLVELNRKSNCPICREEYHPECVVICYL